MLPQFKVRRPYFDYSKAVKGLRLLLWGMFMKVVVADRSGIYVDTVYDNYQMFSGMTCFVTSIMYSIQIYSDFAGYSLMAIGIGNMIGFDIAENFNRPYFSQSVNEFWKRWHISLSSWLRDYIYIPLGGNREGSVKTYRNLLITFLISGLWHGTDWSFMIWGATHALWMILERLLYVSNTEERKLPKVLRILLTFMVVNLAWILFRLPTFHDARGFVHQMITTENVTEFRGPATITICMALLLLIKDFIDEYYPNRILVLNSNHRIIRWGAYICLICLIVLEGVLDSGQFIYGNF